MFLKARKLLVAFPKDTLVECKNKTWLKKVKVRTGTENMKMKNSYYKLLFLKGYRYRMLPGKDIGLMRSFVFVFFFKDGR